MFYNKDIEDIEKELKTSSNGLTATEAKKRIKEYGRNTLPKKKKDSVLKIFFNEFKDPIVILLLFAIIASLIANEVIDAVAIFLIVLIDIIMGTYQENKANNTAEALAKLVTVKTRVVRDGKVKYRFNKFNYWRLCTTRIRRQNFGRPKNCRSS